MKHADHASLFCILANIITGTGPNSNNILKNEKNYKKRLAFWEKLCYHILARVLGATNFDLLCR
jgi:hypothetical protein